MNKNVAICHYRVGKTDGVSLQIMERKAALERMGYRVSLVSGDRQYGADFIIPELEFERPEVQKIRINAFEQLKDYDSSYAFMKDLYRLSDLIYKQLLDIFSKHKFQHLFLHNILTHGRHIAAARAFYKAARRESINVISVNHDLYWSGSYIDNYKPQPFVKEYLQKYVPPPSADIKHLTLNRIAQKALLDRAGLKSTLLPDTYDFSQPLWKKDNFNADLPQRIGINENDLVVLQATRISARKGIEIAVDFVKRLNDRMPELWGRTLYNGKRIDKGAKAVLVLAGYAEKDSEDYKQRIQRKIEQEEVPAVFISDLIDATRSKLRFWQFVIYLLDVVRGKTVVRKKYSLWDCYVFADLVTFPSLWENWGNQFLEAVFAKKPVVVFEYPVFLSDIKPVFNPDIKSAKYKPISLGDKLEPRDKEGFTIVPSDQIEPAVDEAIRVLLDQNIPEQLEKIFQIGREHYDSAIADKIYSDLLK